MDLGGGMGLTVSRHHSLANKGIVGWAKHQGACIHARQREERLKKPSRFLIEERGQNWSPNGFVSNPTASFDTFGDFTKSDLQKFSSRGFRARSA